MLTVKVFVNKRLIAEAFARNVSGLAAISDYECNSFELAGPFTDETITAFTIENHDREQSCWALVERMAHEILEHKERV